MKSRIKDFLNFGKQIIKDSAVLIGKYFFVGIFWIIITVIANRFELKELTYFNAVYSLMILVAIIPFGIVQGVSIYINQNTDSKDSIKSYIKLGFNINLIASLVVVFLLFVFKDFIFSKLVIAEIPDNYMFFHLMLPVTFMIMMCDYFSDIFKALKEQKANLYFSFADFGLTLIAILIVTITGNLSLNAIAICYLVTKFIYIPVFLSYAFKFLTKKFRFDIKEVLSSKVNADKNMIRKVILFGLNEIVWNIAFVISSLVLLKNSELIYNAYNYYENVLDILNGIYFGCVYICGITICKSLGKSKFDEAYKQGKYTILLTVIIWLIIFAITLLFGNWLFAGMNSEIVEIGKYILIAYMFIQLLRFIDWALWTYITASGGELKIMTILNFIWLSYFIILFVISDYVKFNPIILILLIGIDGLVNVILGLIYFKSKKWLVKLDD